jgi:hypothetical protein
LSLSPSTVTVTVKFPPDAVDVGSGVGATDVGTGVTGGVGVTGVDEDDFFVAKYTTTPAATRPRITHANAGTVVVAAAKAIFIVIL